MPQLGRAGQSARMRTRAHARSLWGLTEATSSEDSATSSTSGTLRAAGLGCRPGPARQHAQARMSRASEQLASSEARSGAEAAHRRLVGGARVRHGHVLIAVDHDRPSPPLASLALACSCRRWPAMRTRGDRLAPRAPCLRRVCMRNSPRARAVQRRRTALTAAARRPRRRHRCRRSGCSRAWQPLQSPWPCPAQPLARQRAAPPPWARAQPVALTAALTSQASAQTLALAFAQVFAQAWAAGRAA
jgi:hypothetical protein